MEQRSLLYVTGHREETVIPTTLLATSGWKVCTACDAEATIALLRSEPLDVGLAELPPSSREFVRSWGQVHQARPHMKWIALVPICSVQDQHLREAISTFFYDYHTVPVDFDRLVVTLGHAYGMVAIGEAASRRNGADSSSHRLVGTSAAMRRVHHAIHKFALVKAPVLITGNRYRQGARRLTDPSTIAASQGAVCADQLWGVAGYAHPIGTVRL